jgi:hypothetical protein
VALSGLGTHPLAERRKLLRCPAESRDPLDGRERRAHASDLRLRLVPAPDDTERPGAGSSQVTRGHARGRAGAKLPEAIRLDDGDELGALRVEETDDEGRAVRRRGVQLPAGEADPVVGGRHVGQRALRQPQPPPRRDLDVTGRHPAEARLDRIDRERGLKEFGDVRLGEVERHGCEV